MILAFLTTLLPIQADNWSGNEYAKHSSVQFHQATKLLSRIEIHPTDTLLDIGCGDGRITALLAEKCHVIGIDPSDSMLEKSTKAFPNLTFIKGRAEDFTLEERFDHITSFCAMHWVKNQTTALKNIYHHLKPGGKVYFILATSKEGLPFYAALQKTIASYADDFVDFENPLQTFDCETYRKLMVAAGFHIEAIHYIYHESLFPNQAALQEWVSQWLPQGKHLPEEKRSSFFHELMSHYTDDPTHWGEYFLIVEAKKLHLR